MPEQGKGNSVPCGSSAGESLLCRRGHLVMVLLIPDSGEQTQHPGSRDEVPVWE